MGDRCWLSVTTREQDLPVIVEKCLARRNPADLHSWTEEYERVGKQVYFTVSEANYARDTELRTAGEAGAVFIAENAAGGSYPCGFLVSDGKSVLQIDSADGKYAVSADQYGRVTKKELTAVKRFGQLRRKVQKLLDAAKKDKT